MTIRPVIRMGDPQLLEKSARVKRFGTPELQELLTDMTDTMRSLNGAGLAAPQIGVSLRVVIFGVDENPRYPDAEAVPFTILINPTLTPIGSEMEDDWEGCLSVPGLRGLVPRYVHLRYQGFDADGKTIDRTVEGFHARVVQHEVDHLDGILYPQRIKDMRQFGFVEELDELFDEDDEDDKEGEGEEAPLASES
jgi:peptide deformylase